MPLFCGFVSKFTLIEAGIEAGTAGGLSGVFALILSAFLCAMYTLSVSMRAFFPMKGTDCYTDRADVKETGMRMLIPIVIFGILNIALGIHSQPLAAVIDRIATGKL